MSWRPSSRWRGYVGGAALAFGYGGLFLFALAIPLSLFAAHFWGGFRFREAPQPTPAQLAAAVSHEFWWVVWHRLVPLLAFSISLIAFGFYEAYKAKQQAPEGEAA